MCVTFVFCSTCVNAHPFPCRARVKRIYTFRFIFPKSHFRNILLSEPPPDHEFRVSLAKILVESSAVKPECSDMVSVRTAGCPRQSWVPDVGSDYSRWVLLAQFGNRSGAEGGVCHEAFLLECKLLLSCPNVAGLCMSLGYSWVWQD